MHLLILFCAKYLVAAPPALAVRRFVLSNAGERRLLLLRGLAVLIIGVSLAKGGGALYDHPRPFVVRHAAPMIPHAPDNGFPSDHTLLAFSCAFLLWPFARRESLVLMALSAAVGAGRVASGLHWPVDVLASVAFALIANGIACAFIRPRTGSVPIPASTLTPQKGDTP